jgi:V/A-type H+-transporting ATPase subunit I
MGVVSLPEGVNLLEIAEAVSFLASFKEKTGFIRGMVKIKPLVYQEQLQQVIAGFDYQGMLKELYHLRNHLKTILQHKDRLIQEKQLLSPWQNLRLTLEELHYKQHCGIILGVLDRRDYSLLLEDCTEEKVNLFCEIVHRDRANMYLSILYIQEDFERLEMILKNYHFNFITFPRHKCSVQERIFEINREVVFLDDQIEEVKNSLIRLATEQLKLMLVYDYWDNLRKTQEADKNLAKQQFSFALSGWIKEKDEKLLEHSLKERFKDLAIFISQPKPNEEVPVVLENKPLIQPFEFITGIYGMPKYHEIDPTPFLAPFFFLYFGFCVSDVGYGLMLMAISWFTLKKFRLGPQGKKFFKLFLFCGISTVIMGTLMGSWFGNLFDLLAENNKIFVPLKQVKDRLVVLDPLKEPTKLLAIALGFGIIQVWFGNIVASIGNLKNKRYWDIVLDQVPMLTLLFGLTGLGLIFLKLLGTGRISLFKYATISASLALILTQGRAEKDLGAKLFYGTYNLYNALSGYLSDILSYSRLWALGLVTGVMANTINLISVEFSKIIVMTIPFLDKITLVKILVSSLVLILLFVIGHAVSFLMNLLGAFVHPLRLQFVEFFSKFFKAGGSNFKPFKIETKYIEIT